MKYVIEHTVDGSLRLTGVFSSEDKAIDWALKHVPLPWTLKSLHIVQDLQKAPKTW